MRVRRAHRARQVCGCARPAWLAALRGGCPRGGIRDAGESGGERGRAGRAGRAACAAPRRCASGARQWDLLAAHRSSWSSGARQRNGSSGMAPTRPHGIETRQRERGRNRSSERPLRPVVIDGGGPVPCRQFSERTTVRADPDQLPPWRWQGLFRGTTVPRWPWQFTNSQRYHHPPRLWRVPKARKLHRGGRCLGLEPAEMRRRQRRSARPERGLTGRQHAERSIERSAARGQVASADALAVA
jgi:hypothetical protein